MDRTEMMIEEFPHTVIAKRMNAVNQDKSPHKTPDIKESYFVIFHLPPEAYIPDLLVC
ncbi:MAG: hypothetical protein WC824_01445 [Bacteroidota bacterium]|jgi:hypothetical protein